MRPHLTDQQRAFLDALLAREGRTVTFDDLREALHPDGEERSRGLYNVLACHVRKQVTRFGARIHSVRGEGYRFERDDGAKLPWEGA